jgi:hypothetical protein
MRDNDILFYRHSPRGFSNEYTIYATTPENDESFRELFPEAEVIDRATAIHEGWHTSRTKGQWTAPHRGFARLDGESRTVTEAIDEAIAATQDDINRILFA